MNHPENEIYEYFIDCDLDETNPEALLRTMTRLLEMNRKLDQILTTPFGNITTSDMRIVDLSSGSLRAKLCTLLKTIPDEAITTVVASSKNEKIAYALIKLKEVAINKLDLPDPTSHDFLELTDDLNQTAREHGLIESSNDVYTEDDTILVLSELKKTSVLQAESFPNNDLSFISNDRETPISVSPALNNLNLEDLQIADEKDISGKYILKIKKPDFLKQSQWEFQYEGHKIRARILDDQWLENYQNRKIPLWPGDALEVKLKGSLQFSKTGMILRETYEVTKVFKVIAEADILPIGRLY